MIFAVDNTTEKIIKQLQDAIDGSIRKVHEDQSSLSQEIRSLKGEMSQEEVLDSLRDVRKDFEDLGDKIRDLERSNEDSFAILDSIKSSVKKIEEGSSDENMKRIQDALTALSESILEIQCDLEKVQKKNETIGNDISFIRSGIENIQKTDADILECEKGIEKQLDNLLENSTANSELLNEIKQWTALNDEHLEKIEKNVDSTGKQIENEIKETVLNTNNQTISKIEETIHSSESQIKTEILESIGSSDDRIRTELRETVNSTGSMISTEIKEQSSLTEQRILDNHDELLRIKESVATTDLKLDQLTSDNGEKQKRDDLESEKIDKIIEYLRKPGIARFFSGLKGE